MKAVAETLYWADLLKDNPGNRATLLGMDTREFGRVMRRWTGAYSASDVALLMSEGDLRRHRANGVPTRIIAGCVEDRTHSLDTSDRVAAVLTNAEYVNQPGFCAEWEKIRAASNEWAKQHSQINAKWYPYYEMTALSGLIDDFIAKTKGRKR